MKKSPEEYFSEQDFSVDSPEPGVFTPAERAFMEKYMGVDSVSVLEQLGLPAALPEPEKGDTIALPDGGETPSAPLRATEAPAPAAGEAAAAEASPAKVLGERAETSAPALAEPPVSAPPVSDLQSQPAQAESEELFEEEPLENILMKEPEIQMVGFFIGEQEFTIPTVSVQEVIRSMPVAKLPAAPAFVAGVINLRGRVTPLIELRSILEVNSPRKDEDKFIIVCRCKGLQVGMLIERVHTMYRVPQEDIEWGIEAHLGVNAEYVAGLFKLREQLVSIVSVDRVVAGILK